MSAKIGVVAAMAAMAVRVGIPDVAYAHERIAFERQCEIYKNIDDRSELQSELERLLRIDPDDQCVGVIVGLLGGSPVALVGGVPETEPY
jgi:hypothetical protein